MEVFTTPTTLVSLAISIHLQLLETELHNSPMDRGAVCPSYYEAGSFSPIHASFQAVPRAIGARPSQELMSLFSFMYHLSSI